MAKNMICIENPSQYNNQLLFNLDASDSSNYGNQNRNPGVIVIEKVGQRPKVPHVKPESDRIPLTNERLALAIKLAKLDVSNSQYEDQSYRNRIQHGPKHSKPRRPRIHNEYVSEKEVLLPPKSPVMSKKYRPSQTKVTKRLVKKPKTPKKIQFKEPPTFDDSRILQINEYNRPRNPRTNRQKDVCTSTADLNPEVPSFIDKSYFQQFAEKQDVVKKEKLRKRRNDRAPQKSGFLSLQRSPPKNYKRTSHNLSSPLFKSKQYQVYPKKKPSHKTNPKLKSFQTGLPKPKYTSPSKKLEYSDIATTSEDEISFEARYDDRYSAPRSSVQRNPPKPALKGVKLRNSSSKGVVDSIFDDIVEDTADKIHKMHTSLDLEERAHELNQAGTFETLHQRINDIENEENEIRARWKNIQYDDINNSSKPTIKPQTRSYQSDPEFIHFTVDDKTVPRKSRSKEPYKFVSDKKLSKQSHLSSLRAKSPLLKSKPRIQLSMNDESVQSIMQYKKERQQYLQTCFHEPKGQFNPWKIVEELSNEIMSSVMTSVCGEVNEVCETCVDHIFEGEFAVPNQSGLMSLVDHSSDLSKCEESAVLHEDPQKHSVSFR
uniref:Uncharacterized protein LOC100179520 n=1 Tax=Phallusia mammillata TaxID=59560 RepID=A0A6F9DH35_9ASCI|nr:uncharacterized protein LOC100179520 [Phallusia mammillata]